MYFMNLLKPTSRCERISKLREDLIPFSLQVKFSLIGLHYILFFFFDPLFCPIFSSFPSWSPFFLLTLSLIFFHLETFLFLFPFNLIFLKKLFPQLTSSFFPIKLIATLKNYEKKDDLAQAEV